MLSAAIKGGPVFGAKLKSFDAAKIASMKGVKKVVRSRTTPWLSLPILGGTPRRPSKPCRSRGNKARTTRSRGVDRPDFLKAAYDAEQASFVGNQAGDVKQRSPAPPRRSRRSTATRISKVTTSRRTPLDFKTAESRECGSVQDGEQGAGGDVGASACRSQEVRVLQDVSWAADSAAAPPQSITSPGRPASPRKCRARR